jgi:hypothetical protein
MTWHFRLTKKRFKDEILWGIVEYYEDKEGSSWTEESMIGVFLHLFSF